MAEAAVVVPFRGNWEQLAPLMGALEEQTIRGDITTILSLDGTQPAPDWVRQGFDTVVSGEAAGPAAARNRGWRSTGSEFVLFTDADCVPCPRWAESLLLKLKGEYQAVKGVYSFGGKELIQRLAQVEFMERYRIMAALQSVFLADTYSAGFRRDWLKELDGFDESFPLPEHEDVDLSWRLLKLGGKIGFVPGGAVAHTHRKSWREYFRLKYRRGKWRVMLVRSFPEKAFSDGYTPQTMKLQMLLVPVVLVSLLQPLSIFPGAVALFVLMSIPLMRVAFTHDRVLLPLIPVFCFWRGAALLSGSVAGLFSSRKA